jgi:hypothetical protein
MQSKNIFFPNLFTKTECSEIYSAFKHLLDNGWYEKFIQSMKSEAPLYFSKDWQYYNAVGNANLPATLNHVDRLTELIEEEYQCKTSFLNSYIRLYESDSHLLIHTDREGLDITLSINIWGLENWALNISNVYYETWRADYNWDEFCDKEQYKKDYTPFITPKGSGVSCYGRNFPHWRDTLVCKDNEFVVQLFYHWSIV